MKAFLHSAIRNQSHIYYADPCNNPESTNNFRPISLCSTLYKIIAKMLSNGLEVMLGNIIHPLQEAFILENNSR